MKVNNSTNLSSYDLERGVGGQSKTQWSKGISKRSGHVVADRGATCATAALKILVGFIFFGIIDSTGAGASSRGCFEGALSLATRFILICPLLRPRP